MDQYEAFVKVSLKSRVSMTEDLTVVSLMQFFLYVLKEEAIVFTHKEICVSHTIDACSCPTAVQCRPPVVA